MRIIKIAFIFIVFVNFHNIFSIEIEQLNVLLDSIRIANNKVSSFKCDIFDSTYHRDSSLDVALYKIEKIKDSLLMVKAYGKMNKLKYYSHNRNTDTVEFAFVMDSVEYFNAQKEYLKMTYLSEDKRTAGEKALSRHWLAKTQLKEMGRIDYDVLIEEMAKIKPSEGYPRVTVKSTYHSGIQDSLGVNGYLKKCFFNLVYKMDSVYALSNKDIDLIDRDQDGGYTEDYDAVEITIKTGEVKHSFIVNLENFYIRKYIFSNESIFRVIKNEKIIVR